MTKKQKVLAIVGPTCTGKTALSLCIGKKIPSEIICCDSRNVYKYFDIGTAKPTRAEQAAVPHHLVDVVEPDEDFTAAQFAQMAKEAIAEIASRQRLPVICGGTGFYARALLEGLKIPQIGPQNELREELKSMEEQAAGSLHARLLELDPASAERLNPRDIFRIIRALEVTMVSGKPFSEQAGEREPDFDVLWIGLSIQDREYLKQLIHLRMKEQMEAGMLAEVENLLGRFGASQKLMNTVNYKDFLQHLSGEFDLKKAVEEAERHNYQLARRQIMWFKTNPAINWYYVDKVSRAEIEADVLQKIGQFLSA